MLNIGYEKAHPDAIAPTKAHYTDAGFDLYCMDSVTLYPGQIVKVDTGIVTAIPNGYFGMICDRSGHGSKGVKVFGGIIDPEYRGRIMVCLGLLAKEGSVFFDPGSKIAQLIIMPRYEGSLVSMEGLSKESTSRGDKGFGSSDAKPQGA